MARNARMKGGYASDTFEKDGVKYRCCVFCGEVKPISEYHRNGVDSVGRPEWRLDCKRCYNIRRNENKNKKRHNDFIGGQKRRGESAPDFTHQEWKECLLYFGGECAFCGATPRRGQRLTKDHLDAVSAGGLTAADNIVPACSSCNSSKGANEWRAWFMAQAFFSQDRMNRIFKYRTIMRMIGGGDIDE